MYLKQFITWHVYKYRPDDSHSRLSEPKNPLRSAAALLRFGQNSPSFLDLAGFHGNGGGRTSIGHLNVKIIIVRHFELRAAAEWYRSEEWLVVLVCLAKVLPDKKQ